MILVRDVFRVKFGQMKGAVATITRLQEFFTTQGEKFPMRVCTDVTGPYYTLVLESEYDNLAAYEQLMQTSMLKQEWQEWYRTFTPYLEAGHREIYTIVV